MDLETPFSAGPYKFKSVSGNVKISLPDASGGTIHHKSVSGRVSVSNPAASVTGDRRPGAVRQTIILGSGGPDIHFKSVSGGLQLLSPENGAAITLNDSQKQPAQANGPEAARLTILEQLANGDVSVDDAVVALQNR
jgi:hypothetical protein